MFPPVNSQNSIFLYYTLVFLVQSVLDSVGMNFEYFVEALVYFLI